MDEEIENLKHTLQEDIQTLKMMHSFPAIVAHLEKTIEVLSTQYKEDKNIH